MGICTSEVTRYKRIKKDKKQQISNLTQSTHHHSKNKVSKSSKKQASNQPSQKRNQSFTNDCANLFPLCCLGEIIGETLNYRYEPTKQIVGIGCLVSKNILLASDHYLYFYEASQLSFRPFNPDDSEKIIKIKKCIYPSLTQKEKKRSMYLHKKIGSALFQLQEQFELNQYIQFGIHLQEDEQDEMKNQLLISNLVDESSRLYFQLKEGQILERGWPLLYKLYDRYYCVGLYSSPNTADYILFNEKLVERFKNLETKHYGTESISYIEVFDALVQMSIVNKQRNILQDLIDDLQTMKANANNEQLAQNLFKIGIQYGYQGDLEKQKEFYNRSLKLYLTQVGEMDQNVAGLYHNIGICESELGQIQVGKKWLLKALEIKKALGEQNESIGDTYNQLGVVYRKELKMEEALYYYNQAYKVYSELNFTQKMGMVLNNMNVLQKQEQTYRTNEDNYISVLRILVKAKGQNCLQVAQIYFNLGKMESDCKNYGNSLTYLSKSVNIMKNLKLEGHYHYKTILAEIQDVSEKVLQDGHKKEWILKSKALKNMI